MEKRSIWLKIVIFMFLCTITLTFVYPVIFMMLNSLKTKAEYYSYPFGLPSGKLHFENYTTMISQFGILNLFKNTGVILVFTCSIVLVISIFASYAITKLKFRGNRAIFLAIISTMLIPAQVTLIPVYVMFAKVGLLNNGASVILVYLAGFLPGNILLMTSYFRGISDELIEAGKLDGCNYVQLVRHVAVPYGSPVIVINVIFNAMTVWNDLFTPMILLQKNESQTVMVALAGLVQRYSQDPPYQFAGLLLSAIPAILVYIMLQRFIVNGITMGSIK